MNHELKTLPPFFQAVWEGRKPFEIRRNDRGFQASDTLTLREFNPGDVSIGSEYSGRQIEARITYVCDFEQKPGFVVLGLNVMSMEYGEVGNG